MNAIEQHETPDLDPAAAAEVRERLVDACERAGDAAPAAERQALRAGLLRASRSGLAAVLEQGGI